jgi:thioredoxin-dependent peroxiredoxin
MPETQTPSTVDLKPGDNAPNFAAESTDGSKISLPQFLGRSNVVLYFYPEDMTGGCTVEARNFRDDKLKFDQANTVILGVSLDDRAKHQAFTQKENLNFPLLVDSDATICNAYGVPIDWEHRQPYRWSFLIDIAGKIVQTYHKVDSRIHSQEVLKDIAANNLA